MASISFELVEKILQRVGYPETEIDNFRKRFAEMYFQKIGEKLGSQLSDDQKDDLERILSNPEVEFVEVSKYLMESVPRSDIELINQEVFEELVLKAMDRIVERASSEQKELIRKTITEHKATQK